MAKKVTSCKIDGLRVVEVQIDALAGTARCGIGLEIDGAPAAKAELLHIQTLDGIGDALESFLGKLEEAVLARYGVVEEEANDDSQMELPGLGRGI